MKEIKKEIKFKCVNCGASLNLDDKKCAYCGTINPNYKPKAIKEIKPPKKIVQNVGTFGGLFSNVFNDILEQFDED